MYEGFLNESYIDICLNHRYMLFYCKIIYALKISFKVCYIFNQLISFYI